MKERQYSVKVHSIARFIISMVGVLLTITFLVLDNLPHTDNEFISMSLFFCNVVLSFYLARLIGMAKATIILNEEGVTHIWERKFFLSRDTNHKIPWSLVDNYVFQEDRTFDSFTINLTNRTRYKLYKLNLFPFKDDFDRLVKEFPRLSNQFKRNADTDTETSQVKEGESLYESKSFLKVLYFMAIVFLILLTIKLFNPDSGASWSSLGIIGSAILFYGLMVSKKRNN